MIDSTVEYNLSKYDKLSIGRSEKCDLKLDGSGVSRLHAVILRKNGCYIIEDQQSSNGTFVNNNKITSPKTLENGDEIEISGNILSFSEGIIAVEGKVKIKKDSIQKNWRDGEYAYDYRRTPRLKKELPVDIVEIDAPPSKTSVPETKWFQILASPVVTIIIMVVMAILSFASPMMMIFTIPMSILSIVLAVTNYVGTKKSTEKEGRLREKKYTEYLEEKETVIRRLKKKQIDALQQDSPSLKDCLRIVEDKETRLWSKRQNDLDFLSVRIGSGECAASFSVKGIRDGFTMEEDPLVNAAKEIAKKASIVQGAPVECDVLRDRLIGVVGSRRAVVNLGKNMLVEMSTMHSYEDVCVVTLAKNSEINDWEFVKWLPHSFDEDKNNRFFASKVPDMEQMLKGVEEILKQRELKSAEDRKITFSPHYVFVVTDETQLNVHPTIWKSIFEKDNLGVSAVFLFGEMDKLPKECNTIIEVTETKGVIYSKFNTDKKNRFVLEHIRADLNEYEKFARTMAPIRSVGGVTASSLPKVISFFEGYGIGSAEEINIETNWSKARPQKSMAVPIGIKSNGDTFDFDIFETAHGPHGLVAGTTGAGKTEIIQTWILSMALHFSPQDVSFVLMDFKGTNLILPFQKLPHVAGTISDIDTNIERNILALESEMLRRERLFHENGVTNIKDYLDKYYANDGKSIERISFLFIVVDEFAELKAQFPEFMTWIESTFAKGRSLGLYIILMTQKPDGVVSEKMDANAKFRICLRTQTTGDSKAMLKREDAAFIRNPGRAYIKVGEDELYDLIQSYYCNAPAVEKIKKEKEYTVSFIDDIGRRIKYKDSQKEMEASYKTVEERELLVSHIANFVEKEGIEPARKVWTKRLGRNILLETIEESNYKDGFWKKSNDGFNISVGVVDEPANQVQYPLVVDFVKDGHAVAYGSPQSGKTTLVQTVISAIVRKYTPADANIYVFDFGSHILEGLYKDYPHIGGVASDMNEEKLAKLIDFLGATLENRKEKFASEGVSNLETYCQVSGKKLPYILIAIDRYEVLRENYDDYDDFFTKLSREAGSYGIYLFITTGNINGISYKMTQNIKTVMALQLVDSGDYSGIVGRTGGFVPEDCPGRGLIKGGPPLEFQVALSSYGISEAEKIIETKNLGKDMTINWQGPSADGVKTMPKEIAYGSIQASSEGNVVLGLAYGNIDAVEIPLNQTRLLPITGSDSDTRKLAELVIREQDKIGNEVCLVSIAGKDDGATNASVISNMDAFDVYLDQVIAELNERKTRVDEGMLLGEVKPIVMWIRDYKTFYEEMSEKAAKRMGAIARLGEGLNVFVGITMETKDFEYFTSVGEELCYIASKDNYRISVGEDACEYYFKENVLKFKPVTL